MQACSVCAPASKATSEPDENNAGNADVDCTKEKKPRQQLSSLLVHARHLWILFHFFVANFASLGQWGCVWVGEGALLSPARLNRVKTLLLKTECEANCEPAGSEPIPVWPSGPRLLWKKHHARKEWTLCKQPSGGAATPSLSLTPRPLPLHRLGKSK